MHPSKLIPNTGAAGSEYARLHELFRSSGFDLASIFHRLNIKKLSDVEPLRDRHKDYGPVATASQAFIHLFVEGKPIARTQLESLLGADATALLEHLNLVFPLDETQTSAAVALYPIEHLHIASDRYNSADTSQFEGFDDIVYPCLFETTARFLRTLPRTPCGPVLDLCSGTGVAALLLAKTSEHTYAADITERSRQFALFNQLLNGIPNSSAVIGDLYEPVADLTFDRIVVHPPYQPVYRKEQIFNSGGVDGEQITRRCIEGAYAHLRPGGRIYCVAQITARNEPVDQRVKQWIREACGAKAAANCDVGFYITKRHDLEAFAAKSTLNAKGDQLDFRQWMLEFSRMGVRSLDYGLLIVERHAEAAGGEAFSVCRRAPDVWDPADFEANFSWELARCKPGFESELWSRRFRTTRSCKLEVEHEPAADSGWRISNYRITQNGPFDVKIQASQGLAHLLGAMDGRRTVEECYQELKESGAGVDRNQFAETVIAMVSEGFLLAA